MDYKNLTENEIISFHLNHIANLDDNTVVFSSLTAALRDARELTGRDINNGEDLMPSNLKRGSWPGIICYLIILDQIGKCYKPLNKRSYKDLSPIQRTLKWFTNLSNDKIDVVYALRNALAHDYTISNLNRSKPNLQHHFTLVDFRETQLITLPRTIWDGDPESKSINNLTIISLPLLGDLIELIWNSLMELHSNNKLELILKGGATEIKSRYLNFIFKTT